MRAPKSRSGGAYITVLTVTLLIIMLVAIAISITSVSRRISARYSDYVGLFDLAVAGNDHALFLLRQAHGPQREEVHNRAWQRAVNEGVVVFVYENGGLRLHDPSQNTHGPGPDSRGQFRRIFNEEAVVELRPLMSGMFTFVSFNSYRRSWGIDATISAGDYEITDSYRAVTSISAETGRFSLDTVIHRYTGVSPGVPVTVNASIIWTAVGHGEIVLDAYTIAALILAGVDFPIMPTNGENLILFLDEFAPTMVESARQEVRRRN